MNAPAPGPEPAHKVVDRLPPDLAERVAAEVERSAGDDATVRIGDPQDRRDALARAQQRDTDEVVQGPPLSTAPISGPQARGAIAGAVGFGAFGLVIGLLIGLIPMFDLPLGARLGLWALVGAMAGAAAGFVFGGGREPELEGATRDTSTDVTVAVVSDDPAVRQRAEQLMGEAELEVAERARRLAKRDRPRGSL